MDVFASRLRKRVQVPWLITGAASGGGVLKHPLQPHLREETMATKTDIWMPLYIGDYLADTSHLTAEQSGAYLHLLMHYWRKGPFPPDANFCAIAKLTGPDASSIAQALLLEFFTMNGDGYWHQKRQDIERQKWQQKKIGATEKAAKAAAARWKDAPSIASSNPQAMLQPCPLPLPSPLPLSKPSAATKTAASDSGSELQLAAWLFEEANVPCDNKMVEVCGDCIRKLAKEAGIGYKDAADIILAAARAAIQDGQCITRFWLTDQKYKPQKPKKSERQNRIDAWEPNLND